MHFYRRTTVSLIRDIIWLLCDNAVAGALATSRPTTGLLPDKFGWTTLAAAAVSRTSGLAHTVAGVPTTAVMERTFQYRVLQPRLRLHQLMLYLVRTCCVRSDSVADRTNSFFYSASALLAVIARPFLSVHASVCPSVLPSHSGVLSRRMKTRSCGFQPQVGQFLYYLERYSLSVYSQGITPTEWRGR